jgi:hypothetical protein
VSCERGGRLASPEWNRAGKWAGEEYSSSHGQTPDPKCVGTKHRSEPRQCGEEVLRILVTGGPPVRGGGGMPQRIMISSRSSSALRTTGAG